MWTWLRQISRAYCITQLSWKQLSWVPRWSAGKNKSRFCPVVGGISLQQHLLIKEILSLFNAKVYSFCHFHGINMSWRALNIDYPLLAKHYILTLGNFSHFKLLMKSTQIWEIGHINYIMKVALLRRYLLWAGRLIFNRTALSSFGKHCIAVLVLLLQNTFYKISVRKSGIFPLYL